jgi:Ala-tRNA(Pro) deacylase
LPQNAAHCKRVLSIFSPQVLSLLHPVARTQAHMEVASLAHLSPQEFLDRLSALGIKAETVEHEPVFTVAESASVKERIPGAHSKNLFVKDKKGRFFLISAKHDTAIDLKRTHEAIGASGRLSFGSADQLRALLGVEPGSVTAFAVVNDPEGKVTMVLDANLMEHERLNFHPLVNSMTTGVSRDDLIAFLRATGHDPMILRLPEPPAELPDNA